MFRNLKLDTDSIQNLKIETREEYNGYLYLLSLPSKVYKPIIYGIIDGKITINDLRTIISKIRKGVYNYNNDNEEDNIKERLLNKFINNSVTSVSFQKNFNVEQFYIAKSLEEKGIILPEDSYDSIFIDERNVDYKSLNFYNIELKQEDYIYMSMYGLNEIQMKKKKLLDNFLMLKKNYKLEW